VKDGASPFVVRPFLKPKRCEVSMAGVEVQGNKGQRSTNADINMIPFIDLLMVTVAFLLITAVWTTQSRIPTNAEVPGPPSDTPVDITNVEKVLHVDVQPGSFKLSWRQGSTVVSELSVARTGANDHRELAAQIEREWASHGSHRDAADQRVDQAVLHTDNQLPFHDITAVLDALGSTKRRMVLSDQETMVSAFNPTFSVR
jgi:biopolymer transport protein ExbD